MKNNLVERTKKYAVQTWFFVLNFQKPGSIMRTQIS